MSDFSGYSEISFNEGFGQWISESEQARLGLAIIFATSQVSIARQTAERCRINLAIL